MKFLANDGTIFDDMDECENYESSAELRRYKDDIICLDSDGDNIKPTEVDRVFYISTKSKEALSALKNYYDIEGYQIPDNIGAYYYDEKVYKWVKADNKIKEYENEIERLKKLVDNLKVL